MGVTWYDVLTLLLEGKKLKPRCLEEQKNITAKQDLEQLRKAEEPYLLQNNVPEYFLKTKG